MKKSYFKDGLYFDTTTGRTYEPKHYCEICKTSYRLSVHHYLNQQKCLKDLASKKVKHPKDWTKEFIDENQKLFTLCFQCHADVENLADDKFKRKYGVERSRFIWREDAD